MDFGKDAAISMAYIFFFENRIASNDILLPILFFFYFLLTHISTLGMIDCGFINLRPSLAERIHFKFEFHLASGECICACFSRSFLNFCETSL